ncbi:cytochrome C [Methylocystis bryophila]|uniref:cytochrome C n=1 Tax=Methylocystis bryophila TaxID=655015 RepID=UPI00131A2DD5|nr:cytochrome C [Methylocystis bryophila]BDV39871.1 hypothetical protein DSM21852_31240 [Methylocystis bryophila]
MKAAKHVLNALLISLAAMSCPSVAVAQTAPSLNSTSVSRAAGPYTPVPQQSLAGDASHRVIVSNDLGMHCADLDTRIASILPPFNVLHAQVIARGARPALLDSSSVSVFYSASSNPNDPAQGASPIVATDGSVYKTNFWIDTGAYAAFYPPAVLSQFFPSPPIRTDIGLPVPDLVRLYLGDGKLTLRQQTMPDVTSLTLNSNNIPLAETTKPYVANAPQPFASFEGGWPLFKNFPFGYVANNVKWFAAEGIPLTPFDDVGRENPFSLMRVQAKSKSNNAILASVDTVVPVSGDINCKGCHLPAPYGNGLGTKRLSNPLIPSDDPMYGHTINWVSEEWAADVNTLRAHDLMHGTSLYSGYDHNTGAATHPVVCQSCHYTPALDLAQAGPQQAGGLTQTMHQSMSRVMHNGHGNLKDKASGLPLFPTMPAPNSSLRANSGPNPINAFTQATLGASCYQCHPGERSQCLRGAMFSEAGAVCQDCHGQMKQIGDDFSRNLPTGSFILASDYFKNPATPRVPWAHEPTCGSCHTGDAVSNMASSAGAIPASDHIRLLQAYLSSDPKATPILPTNMRFAEPRVSSGPAAGSPQLFRLSVDTHGGVFCEGCHGATHAEWPVHNAAANDNVEAVQLQGHAGKIVECGVCHTGTLGATLSGPHGMHPVGNDGNSARWADGHGDFAEGSGGVAACKSCHGAKGEGTPLAKVAVDRPNLPCEGGSSCRGERITLTAGTLVSCGLCHRNPVH